MANATDQVPKTAAGGFATFVKSPDVQFALGVVALIFMMIVPLHPLVLDMLLSMSITFGIMILLIAIYIKEPLDFSTFPTLLLLTTLFRLALNVATTRSILLDGTSDDVSQVIRSFGQFVVGGNYFVGFVVFTILVIVNFIVITKGAGRVAEVGARFTLDAMPGKQMSIDAELNAGHIDREEAKRRRRKIEMEADFYGAMDGASKFVRGDAIAGIIITLINIIVGLIIGVVDHDMSFAESASRFTLLTVGDGLVSQIPALIISTAAGIVVTRTSSDGGLSDQLGQQILFHPKALFICAVLVAIMALIPGLPAIPFGLLSVGLFFLGRYTTKRLDTKREEELAAASKAEKAEKPADSIEQLLHVDTLALEVGVELIPLVDSHQDGEVLERIVSARKQFAQDMGIIVPMVMVRDNIQLRSTEYQIVLRGNVIGKGGIYINHFLAMEPGHVPDPVEGIPTKEPAYGLNALWIKPSVKDEASFRGYTVVNAATVIVTHLNKLVQDNAHELVGRQEAQFLIDGLKERHPKVVEEVLGADRLELGDVVKVFQNLLAEGVSIRDLVSIFEALADTCRHNRNPDVLTRHVRKAISRGIVARYLSEDETLYVCSVDRTLEDLMLSGLQQHDDGTTALNLEPQIAQQFLNNLAACLKGFETVGTTPILMCSAMLRWDLRRLVHHFIPGVVVLAVDEIPTDIQVNSVGTVSL